MPRQAEGELRIGRADIVVANTSIPRSSNPTVVQALKSVELGISARYDKSSGIVHVI
jgi:hypothetical protein